MRKTVSDDHSYLFISVVFVPWFFFFAFRSLLDLLFDCHLYGQVSDMTFNEAIPTQTNNWFKDCFWFNQKRFGSVSRLWWGNFDCYLAGCDSVENCAHFSYLIEFHLQWHFFIIMEPRMLSLNNRNWRKREMNFVCLFWKENTADMK